MRFDGISLSKLSKQDFKYKNKLTQEQEAYVNSIYKNLVTIVNSKAGTGKTVVGTMALKVLLDRGFIDQIYYVISPVQERVLGYTTGDLPEKMTKYAFPFIDALKSCEVPIGFHDALRICDESIDGDYKAVSHTFFRGRTLSKKGVILDEAQNYTTDELRKTLTRFDDDCAIIMIGHDGQIDIAKDKSGFTRYINHFKNGKEKGIFNKVDFINLTHNFRGEISKFADDID